MWKYFMKHVLILFTVFFVTGCDPQPSQKANSATNVRIDKFKDLLVNFKKSEKIEGLAFAIFDNNNVIWQQCLGNSTYGYPINDKTLFSIQSISKNITALAVLIAVQDGLLDLDLPISHYLPGFKVNSCFEVNPEKKITLRMLLSHTAGFTHEAPVGNNYDYAPCSFDDHLKSISSTWLKFAVGTDYSYSNLGLDLAAKIVEQISRMKFNDYLKIQIFEPLGMNSTTLDDFKIVTNTNKTEGTISSTTTKHYNIPLIGSGAVYTDLSDFIKYVQLQMNFGEFKGKKLIDKIYLYDMYTIRFHNYGLGTYIDKSDSTYYINHNGSGCGYSASFLWYPEYNIGAVMLCNKQCTTFGFCENILKNYFKSMNLVKDNSVTSDFNNLNGKYFTESNEINDIKKQFCSNDTLYKANWKKYVGTYAMILNGLDFKWYAKLAFAFGFYTQKVTIVKEGQTLKIKSSLGESIMREYNAGMFFTNGGEVIIFNTETPTYKNIKLKKLK
ncbi:class A beta-lactamase-related serine hydrolase [bacterium]|nr:MAG: class A beta-lactamase-related serine hydrolase [bacterium]